MPLAVPWLFLSLALLDTNLCFLVCYVSRFGFVFLDFMGSFWSGPLLFCHSWCEKLGLMIAFIRIQVKNVPLLACFFFLQYCHLCITSIALLPMCYGYICVYSSSLARVTKTQAYICIKLAIPAATNVLVDLGVFVPRTCIECVERKWLCTPLESRRVPLHFR